MPTQTVEEQPEQALGYDFKDDQTDAQLELLDELQRLGVSQYIGLPQLVVVGDQSTGKSSVLQAVTDLPFAVDDQMCTRFATEIVLRRSSSETTSIDISIIPSPNESQARREALSNWKPKDFPSDGVLTKSILKRIFLEAEVAIFGSTSPKSRQREKSKEARQTLNPFDTPSTPTSNRSLGSSSFNPEDDFADFSGRTSDLFGLNLQQESSSISDQWGLTPPPSAKSRTKQSQSRLSGSTLRITRSGPKENNFAVVDVPGLVRVGDGDEEHNTAKALVQTYLNNPKSIVVVVIDIVDIERQEIFHMLKQLPYEEDRVIGVINKCDTKLKKSSDWVFDLIRNDKRRSRKYLKEGWYGLRNRLPSEQDVSDESRDKTEREFFKGEEWNELDPSKLGRHQLKKALVRMRNQHLGRTIPKLAKEIQAKLTDCKSQLQGLGQPRVSNQTQFAFLNSIAMQYSDKVRSALEGRYNDLQDQTAFVRTRILIELDMFQTQLEDAGPANDFHTAEDDVGAVINKAQAEWGGSLLSLPTYQWILEYVRKYRSTADRRRPNPDVESTLWRIQTEDWINTAEKFLESIKDTIISSSEAILAEVCTDQRIRDNLLTLILKIQDESFGYAKSELKSLWDDEKDGRMSTFQRRKTELETSYHSERIKRIVQTCNWEHHGLPSAKFANEYVSNALRTETELDCVLNLHDSLRAYYEIALGRFIDNFATQVVERHLLGVNGALRSFSPNYVTDNLYGPEKAERLQSLVGEEPEVARRRQELVDERESLKASLAKVAQFGHFSG